jgi:hypothetical protein
VDFPLGYILALLLFIIYINNLPFGTNSYSSSVLFVDDKSVLITASNLSELQTKCTCLLNYLSKWFAVNGLTLNIEKTNALHLNSNLLQNEPYHVFFYQGPETEEVTNIKFMCYWWMI